MTTNTWAVRKNANGDLEYNWLALDAAASKAGVDAENLRDYVFESVTDVITAGEAVAAFIDYRTGA